MSGKRLISGSTFSISDGSTTVATNDVQTITVTATGGTLVLGYSGGLNGTATELTTGITMPGTAAAVQAALIALPNIGNNTAGLPNVAVTGSAGGPYTVTAQNDLAGQLLPILTVDPSSAMTGGTATILHATPGIRAGGVYAAVASLTDIVFPTTKKDVKETTNLDSAGFTKEYIGGFINPGDVKISAMWTGGATQDWRTGLIQKFYGGQSFAMRTNVPNAIPKPGDFTPGLSIAYNGFLTDGTPSGAKHDDVLGVSSSVQISGLPIFGMPSQ